MKSFTGIGTGKTQVAIEEATRGLTEPKVIVVFAAVEDIEQSCEILRNKYKDIDVIGIIGSSFNNGNIIDSSNFSGSERNNMVQVMAFFDDAEVSCGVMDRLDEVPLYTIRKFEEDLKKVNGNKDNTVCMGFVTDYEENFVSTSKTILEKQNIQLIGGIVSGCFGKDLQPFVMLNDKKYEHAAVYMFVKNKTGKIRTFRNDTYVKATSQVMQITKVSGGKSQRVISEIDGRNTIQIFKEKFDINERNYDEKALDFTLNTPLGIVIGDETYVISVKSANSDGTVETYKKVYEGGAITFLEMGDYESMEKEVLEKIKRDLPKRSFVFSIDCLYRFVAYSKNGYLNEYVKGMSTLGTHVGLIGLGEQNTHQHVNQTMICAVFE